MSNCLMDSLRLNEQNWMSIRRYKNGLFLGISNTEFSPHQSRKPDLFFELALVLVLKNNCFPKFLHHGLNILYCIRDSST